MDDFVDPTLIELDRFAIGQSVLRGSVAPSALPG